MRKAKYLLLNEDLSVSEISFKVGFSSQEYFSTVFKSKFGVTPNAFKEKKTLLGINVNDYIPNVGLQKTKASIKP